MGKIGEIMICAHCGKEVIRTSGGQKYCDDCKAEANYMKSRAARNRALEKRHAQKPLRDFQCSTCGVVFQSKYKRLNCEPCAKAVHMEQIKAYNRERAQERRASMPVVIEMPKPKFSLAEVNQAARKHNMTYGQYCAAWKMGTVEEPKPIEKKRGRKRAKILDW